MTIIKQLAMAAIWFAFANLGVFLIAMSSLTDDKRETRRFRREVQGDLPWMWASIWQ